MGGDLSLQPPEGSTASLEGPRLWRSKGEGPEFETQADDECPRFGGSDGGSCVLAAAAKPLKDSTYQAPQDAPTEGNENRSSQSHRPVSDYRIGWT